MGLGAQALWTGQFMRIDAGPPGWIATPMPGTRLIGVILLVAGLAIAAGRRVRLAAALVAGAFVLELLIQLAHTATRPGAGFMWIAPFKTTTLIAGALAFARIRPGDSHIDRAGARCLLFGNAVVLASFLFFCGTQHFIYASFTADMVPPWMPAHLLWAYFTGTAQR